GTVHIIGTYNDATHADYRYVHYWQCLPGTGRLGNQQQAEEAEPESLTRTVNFYPSPSNGSLTVDLNGQSGGLLELFNLAGQLVFTEQINQSGEIQLPESLVKDGVYLLKFTITNAAPQMNKLIIQRNK
ncbi:MAG: T9SS type A sorting domain-containing protein, partial [Flavobacterium sp.]